MHAHADGKPTPHDSILHNVTPFHGAIRVGDWKLVRNGHMGANATEASEAVEANIPPNRPSQGFRVPKTWGHAD